MLQGALLAGGTEDVTEPVNDEVEPKQERERGQHQRRRPQVAPQATVEQARGDEAAGQPGIVEALHPDQPRAIVARRGVDGRVGVGAEGPGADQHGALAGARHAVEVDAAARSTPRALERSRRGRGSRSAGSTTTTTSESGRAANAASAAVSALWAPARRPVPDLRGSRRPPAGRRARRCPDPASPPASARCRGWSPGSSARFGRQQQVAQHHGPPAERDPHRRRPGSVSATRSSVSTSLPCTPIVSPLEGRAGPLRGIRAR